MRNSFPTLLSLLAEGNKGLGNGEFKKDKLCPRNMVNHTQISSIQQTSILSQGETKILTTKRSNNYAHFIFKMRRSKIGSMS